MNGKMKNGLLVAIVILISTYAQTSQGQIYLEGKNPNAIIPFDIKGELTAEFKKAFKKNLEGVEIVALGETMHEDGLTFKYKTKLVEFLHKELGFNVLAFEFGFYGNWLTNKKLKQGVDVKKATQFSGWAKSKYAFPVYQYMSQSHGSSKPLIYAGFDGEKLPDGIPNVKILINEITNLVDHSLEQTDRLILDSLVHAIYGRLRNPFVDKLTYKSRKKAKSILNELIVKVNQGKKQIESTLGNGTFMMYKLTLQSILMDVETTFAGTFWNSIRDKNMAQRVSWLKDSLYAGEKIILWGASSHFARNMLAIERDMESKNYDFYPYYQMGDWLYNQYSNAYYSLAFTCASGKIGTIYPEKHKYKKYEQLRDISQPHFNSFENIAYQSGQPTLFCDLRKAEENSWLSSSFIAYPFGYNQDYAPWNKILDGLFFIREMKPDAWRDDL